MLLIPIAASEYADADSGYRSYLYPYQILKLPIPLPEIDDQAKYCMTQMCLLILEVAVVLLSVEYHRCHSTS